MTKEIIKIKDQYFASCPSGLEELLAAEVKSTGYKSLQVVKGGVHFETKAQSALELILCSRIASRVFRKCYQFEIKNEKDLYHYAKEIKWKALFNLDQTFKINVVQGKSKNGEKRSQFKSSMFLAQNLKDGIVDRFRDDCKGERPSIDKEDPDITLLLRVEPNDNPYSQKEECMILMDMCGRALNKRGYRDTNFSAPLKENLAAGLVLLAGYTGEEDFIDPMCGSGTIIIESLLIKGQIPPCYLALHYILEEGETEYWSFLKHNWYKKDKYLIQSWSELLNKYLELARDGFEKLDQTKFKTYASDSEQYSINAINFNLKAAELLEYVTVEKKDAIEVNIPSESGVLVTNPPYGERIGEEDDLPGLYYNFGENLKKNFTNFRAYIFSGNFQLIKKISLRTSKKIILWNGNIESRLAEYKLY